MNCRVVENGLFPKPNLQRLLKSKFVEVRLHTDMTQSHPNFGYDKRIKELRDQFLGKDNVGLPQYVIVAADDPKTVLAGKYDGSKGGVDAFRVFFEQALAQRSATKSKAGG